TDRSRRLLWIGPRTRERVKAGISMRSRLLPQSPRITEIAHQINDGMPLRGPWFFQLKRDRHGAWKLLEISCRVAGTMAAQR
ncbi:ATP-grasp domain-containing protein, partial [Listeria monocytogenes]|uniref:ATP-grasp domain-containing protein n=3 Tax=Bacteria TaxID=2 RepID=UPI003F671D9B